MNGEMMMRPPVPAPYQVWAAALAQQQQLPPVAEAPPAGFKPARPAWKRAARQQPGWKQRKAAAQAQGRWGGSAAPRNTTSYLIRAKRAGGVASLVSPCPVTPAVLPTPRLSPAREVLVEMAKEAWGVDGYGSMKGLIRLRPQAAGPDTGDGDGADSGSGESDVEEHVELRRRLVAVESLCRDRHRDGCVVDAALPSPAETDEAATEDAMVL
ncbi:unnamed protein product [Triticum turgidum subsp. durum]|uniref:Uncharacterized protein n=1 Tax=Triticum turgidum subsp. durum TaxID=4567 RepID=A0A9R0TVP1_TRITD|nr:unnamed protein product [Triticum turgidum subsp. durum]